MFMRQIRMKLSMLMICEEKRVFVEIGTQMEIKSMSLVEGAKKKFYK